MVLPSLPIRDTVFLGVVQQSQGAVRSEISSNWAYAYMMVKLGPVKFIGKPSKQLRLEETVAHENGIAMERSGRYFR